MHRRLLHIVSPVTADLPRSRGVPKPSTHTLNVEGSNGN